MMILTIFSARRKKVFRGIKAILKEFKKRQDAEAQKSLVYSQNETDTGKIWIDGKKIYRKVINCGVLPNNSLKIIPTNITNIEKIINLIVTASSKRNDLTLSLPFYNINGDIVTVYKQNNDIVIGSNLDVSYYGRSFAILEYTKTTN